MSFLTYRLSRRLGTMDEGATEAQLGEVQAIIKQDHAAARVQVYSELVAHRLAALVGVDVATGALVAHDTGLKYASLRLANIAAGATVIETEEQFERASRRYASQCARIAVFDLWIGNEDRVCNLMASIGPDTEYLIVAFDHGRTLLGCVDGVRQALEYLKNPKNPKLPESHPKLPKSHRKLPKLHPMSGLLNRAHCELMVERIQNINDDLIYELCDLGDTCGSVMPVEQAALCDALVKRQAFLPDIVERVLFAEDPIAGNPS